MIFRNFSPILVYKIDFSLGVACVLYLATVIQICDARSTPGTLLSRRRGFSSQIDGLLGRQEQDYCDGGVFCTESIGETLTTLVVVLVMNAT